MEHSRKKTGLFLGTFDPIHNDHLKIIQFLSQKLDDIYIQPHPDFPGASASQSNRGKMIELAIFPFRNVHLRLNQKHGSRESCVQEFIQEFPASEVWVIMGSDKLLDPVYASGPVLKVPHIIFTRDNASIPKETLEKFASVQVFDLHTSIASAKIRSVAGMGLNIRDFVPEKVQKFIVAKKLYRNR